MSATPCSNTASFVGLNTSLENALEVDLRDSLRTLIETDNRSKQNPSQRDLQGGDKLDKLLSEEKEVLRLRSYQDELVEPCLSGRNAIVCAPTGSGKTLVAVKVIQEHLRTVSRQDRMPRVVFFVPTVPLVDQQSNVLRTYLSDDYKITALRGGECEGPKTNICLASHVTVMTPQILLNMIQDPHPSNRVKITQFTLLIFDECHHCDKGHPYNDTMVEYMDLKFAGVPAGETLPQILGLTASLGVGKADTPQMAIEHVVSMAANMDADVLSTVRNCTEDLAVYVNQPLDELVLVRGSQRKEPFTIHVEDQMRSIENRLRPVLDDLKRRKLDIMDGLDVCGKEPRAGDSYAGWVNQLLTRVPTLQDSDEKQTVISLLEMLKIYQEALTLNSHVPVEQAVRQIHERMAERHKNVVADVDYELLEKYKNNLEPKIRELSDAPPFRNELVHKLRSVLIEETKKRPDLRAIVFVKTRALTKAVKEYLRETHELQCLNSETLTSVNTSSEKEGQTPQEQERVLQDFRSGNCKLIVATTVAEEGLDIAKCNLIVKYNHVTDEKAMVQKRGRGRAQGSRSILLAREGAIADKEMANMIKEKLMKRAIEDIRNKGSRWFRAEVEKKEKRYHEDRLLDRTVREKKKMELGNQTFNIGCRKCDSFLCASTKVKQVLGAHYVVTDPDIWRRCNARAHHSPRVLYQMSIPGKISCPKCSNDLGNILKYRRVFLPALKAEAIVIQDSESKNKKVKKKWCQIVETFFVVDPINTNDLTVMANRLKEELEKFLNDQIQQAEEAQKLRTKVEGVNFAPQLETQSENTPVGDNDDEEDNE